MPEFAQFVALRASDTPFEATGRLFTFDLPDFDRERTVILMFKVSGPGNTRLQMTVNNRPFSIDFELDSSFTRPRSWHEIVDESNFQVGENRLIVQGGAGQGASPIVSDIVVLYHAKTP